MTDPRATKRDQTRPVDASPRALTPAQLAAVDLVVLGKSDPEVGEAVGVGRQRVFAWRHYSAEFQAAVHRRRREVFGQASDRLRTLLVRAIDVLAAELDTAHPDSDTLKVALKVLDYGAPLLAGQLVQPGPQDVDAVLEAEAGRRNGQDLSRLIAGGGPGPAAELRREWAERLAAAEAEAVASDGHETPESDASAR